MADFGGRLGGRVARRLDRLTNRPGPVLPYAYTFTTNPTSRSRKYSVPDWQPPAAAAGSEDAEEKGKEKEPPGMKMVIDASTVRTNTLEASGNVADSCGNLSIYFSAPASNVSAGDWRTRVDSSNHVVWEQRDASNEAWVVMMRLSDTCT